METRVTTFDKNLVWLSVVATVTVLLAVIIDMQYKRGAKDMLDRIVAYCESDNAYLREGMFMQCSVVRGKKKDSV